LVGGSVVYDHEAQAELRDLRADLAACLREAFRAWTVKQLKTIARMTGSSRSSASGIVTINIHKTIGSLPALEGGLRGT
jgi:hypothetical protein